MNQKIQFCSAPDGVSIAYASIGSGPPLVKAANWMNHLEHDVTSPVWRHLLEEFSSDHELIRYDERGTGLSDRDARDLTLDAFVGDLEAVIDSCGLAQFPLFAISQGGPVAIAYAARHPEKVSHLVLLGSFATGWKRLSLPPHVMAQREAETTLIRQGWGSKNPALRQFWTTLCIPGSTPEESDSFNELQRASATAENAARIYEAIGEFDVSGLLAELDLPVLVVHANEDSTVPFEEGRKLAAAIPNSKFVSLEGPNHLLLSHEPAWPRFVQEVRSFLGRPAATTEAATQTMKMCGKCRKVYGEEMLFCLDDGTRLTRSGLADVGDEPATRLF